MVSLQLETGIYQVVAVTGQSSLPAGGVVDGQLNSPVFDCFVRALE